MPACRRSRAWRSFCDERFEDDAPAFSKLKTALTEVRQTVHTLLNKKREKEPDPVEEVPVAEAAAEVPQAGEDGNTAAPASTGALARSDGIGARRPPPGSSRHRRSRRLSAQAGTAQPGALPHFARSALG